MSDDANNTPTFEDDGREIPLTALVAREMADLFPDFDWDAWKDEIKEGDL
jgi:hypothetical protein